MDRQSAERQAILSRLNRRFELAGPEHLRLLSMEGLRGIAVLLVFVVHYVTLVTPWISSTAIAPIAQSLHRLGNIGVDLFFVLSGFLIYGSLIRKPTPFLPFMRRRIQRLYPTFLTVFIIYIALSFIFPQESKIPDGALAATFYIISNLLFLPGIFDINPIISVAWSLSYEMFFYVGIPILIALLGLRRWDWRTRAALILATIVLWQGLDWPHSRMGMFATGMILAECLPHLRHSPALLRLDAGALIGLPVLFAGIIILGYSPEIRLGLSAILFMTCLAAFSHHGLLHKVLTLKYLRWLGNMSYSYYLIHGLTLKACFLVMGKILPPTGHESYLVLFTLPSTFIATLAVSACLYLLIEHPFSIEAPIASPARTALEGSGCDLGRQDEQSEDPDRAGTASPLATRPDLPA